MVFSVIRASLVALLRLISCLVDDREEIFSGYNRVGIYLIV